MKTKTTLLILSAFLLDASSILHAQTGGSLTPPGAPAQTMKSLDQMEPRTPLVAGAPGVSVGLTGTITIAQSGSYYLTGNLTVTEGDGIVINASGVTLDLRGFTITSTAALPSNQAIDVNGSNIAIFNGHIVSGTIYNGGAFSGSGFAYGIYASSSSFENIRIREVSVQGCGVHGIFFFDLETTLVESCTVSVSGSLGIRAGVVRDCAVRTSGSVGITAETVTHCRAESVASSAIFAGNVLNCYGITTSPFGDGIFATRSVQNSYGSSTGGDGIDCSGNVSNSYGITTGTSSGANGIRAFYNVSNSYGKTSGDDGISGFNVFNSVGTTDGTGAGADGISASFNVMNSYGESAGDDAIDATYTISYSRGATFGTGVALECNIAIGCTSSGGETITNKYLMP